VEVKGESAKVELGEGVIALCQIRKMDQKAEGEAAHKETEAANVSSLGAMLAARWKQGGGSVGESKEMARAGEIRSFRIARLDPAKRLIELELAS
jgi:small subunit ribosomal protein S1